MMMDNMTSSSKTVLLLGIYSCLMKMPVNVSLQMHILLCESEDTCEINSE